MKNRLMEVKAPNLIVHYTRTQIATLYPAKTTYWGFNFNEFLEVLEAAKKHLLK